MKTVQYAFNGGEYAPELSARGDISRYDLGARTLENFVVNYGGGAFKRRGLVFGEFVETTSLRAFNFQFSNNLENAYLVLFGPGWARFVIDNAYVLDTVQSTTVSSGTFTLNGHGYTTNDLVYVDGVAQVCRLTNVTLNTFEVQTLLGATPTVADGSVNIQHVFQLASPYAAQHLRDIVADQVYDTVRLTHPEYEVHVLERTTTTWTLTKQTISSGVPLSQTVNVEDSGAYISHVRVTNGGSGYTDASTVSMSDPTGSGWKGAPTVDGGAIVSVQTIREGSGYTNPTLSTARAGGATFDVTPIETDAGFAVAISAVDTDGIESGPTETYLHTYSINFTQTRGSATYSLSAAVEGAVRYRFYRSLVLPDWNDAHVGQQLGLVGESVAPRFTDNNVQPDFTKQPRRYRNPFAHGAIKSITVTNGGSGYTTLDTFSISDPNGSGFEGFPIIVNGAVTGIVIQNPGTEYTNPTGVMTPTGAGSGATFTFEVTELTGNNPAVAFTFQQRAGYAGTFNDPMTIWASSVGNLENFAQSDTLTADNPYEYTLDAPEITPILSALPVQRGLLVFTQKTVSMLFGRDGEAVTPLNGKSAPQTFVGAAKVPPQRVGDDVVYVTNRHRGLQLLTLNPTGNRFDGREISVLARHIFKGKNVLALAFAYDTDNTGYGVLSDGTAFAVTIDRAQETFAFSRLQTKGKFLDVVTLDLGTTDDVYFLIQRKINGVQVASFERIAYEPTPAPEDMIYLDAATSISKIHPAADLTITYSGDVATLTASSAVFASGDVDKAFGSLTLRGYVTEFVSSTVVRVTLTRSDSVDALDQGEWWLNPLVSTISNIPLEGETVRVCADGKTLPDKIVINGSITLDYPAAIVHVGLPYSAKLKTLPIVGDQAADSGEHIQIYAGALHYQRLGAATVNGYDLALRGYEPWSEPLAFDEGEKYMAIGGMIEQNSGIEIISDNALPCEILQITQWYHASG